MKITTFGSAMQSVYKHLSCCRL